MNPILVQMISYTAILIFAVFIIGFMQRGFFLAWLSVRTSFGNKVLVREFSTKKRMFKAAKIIDGQVEYKEKEGNKKYSVPADDSLYWSFGVLCIDINVDKGCIIKPDYSSVKTGYDPIKWDNLLKRALYRPAIMDNKEKVMFLLLIICIIATVASIYLNSTQQEIIIANQEAIKQQIGTIGKGMITAATKA